jgi:four helix bundle protein
MRNYKKYDVWEKSHQLVLFIYKFILPALPKNEQFDLASQIKRAAYSVPMNIAEGSGRNSDKDFVHFLDISLGSVHELEYCILLCSDLTYIENGKSEKLIEMINEVKAKLINLIKSIRKSSVML